jgi:hypothetical protein
LELIKVIYNKIKVNRKFMNLNTINKTCYKFYRVEYKQGNA